MAFLTDFLIGGVSGSIAKTATAPIERVKLVLQNQDKNDVKYHGMMDAFQKIIKEEGGASLWRGNTANLVRYFPTQALNFMFKEKYKRMFVTCSKDENFTKFFTGNLLAGGMAGATGLCGVYPLDYARNALAVSKDSSDTMLSVISKKYSADGLKGLYQGFAPSVAGIFFYRGAYFGLHDIGKAVFPSANKNPVSNLALAFTTDTIAGVVAYPFDTVRRRMMMQSKGDKKDLKYNSSVDCFRKIVREEGVSTLFNGCFSNIVRGLGGALVLVVYDEAKKKTSVTNNTMNVKAKAH